jgi:Sulfotransferase domain
MVMFALERQLAGMRHRIFNGLLRKAPRRGIDYDPYDRATRERLAERMFDLHKGDVALGTVERGRLILDIIQDSFPTEALASAYFENLELLLKFRQPRRTPGRIVLGVGSGRNGSTSLAAALATVEGSCSTHENPPLISWIPEAEELQFHVRRFQRLAEYFSLIVDVSHWWLNVIDDFFTHFPDAKVIGVFRNLESCTNSFMKIKGFGRGSYNHWVPYGNGIWAAAQWDPTYPTYTVPEKFRLDPDGAKFELIMRYVREYNDCIHLLAARLPEKVLLVKTEELNNATAQKALFDFIGMRGVVGKAQLNVGTIADGRKFDYKF